VNVTTASLGSFASAAGGGGEDARDVSVGREAFFSSYFWRFFIFEGVGFRTVYLEVMRV
jgi:hypothetical protein